METMFDRFFNNLFGRIHGPMSFRFILQPMVAAFLAFHAGIRDARRGRRAYGWALCTEPGERSKLLHECWHDIARVFIAAVLVDFIYEIIVFKRIYPGESLFLAIILALVPYLLLRGPVNRLICLWHRIQKRLRH